MAQQHAPKGPIKAKGPLGQQTLERRCAGHSSRTGAPCKKFAIHGGTVCDTHGGRAPQVKRAALERLRELQDPAIDAMGWLIQQRDFPSAAYAASRDVLDRTEGKPAESVAIEHSGGLVIKHEI